MGQGDIVSVTQVEATELIRAVAETSPAMLWMGDAERKCAFLNAALRRFWGVNPARLEEFDWSSTLHPDDVEMLAGPFARAMAEQTPFRVQARYRRADGVYRTMRTKATPRFSTEGHFLGMTGVNVDITEQLAAELLGELNHRTKNILALVQAVARQTAQAGSLEGFLRSFDERLRGAAASNDLLLQHDWSSGWKISSGLSSPTSPISSSRGLKCRVLRCEYPQTVPRPSAWRSTSFRLTASGMVPCLRGGRRRQLRSFPGSVGASSLRHRAA